MEAIIESFEEQVDTILKEIRDGFATIFSGSLSDEIVSFLDDGLTIDYDDPNSVGCMILFLVQIDRLSERLGLEGKDPVTMVDGPEKVLAMLISVLRCMIGQLVTVLEPSTSNGEGAVTLESALAEVKKEITTDDDNAEAIEVNESDILGALNALNGQGTRKVPYIPGTSSRFGRSVTSNNAALIGPPIPHCRALIQRGRMLSKYLDFSEAEKQVEEVDIARHSCPYCDVKIMKTTGTLPRSGLYTRHIRECHREKWTSYAKIKCAAKECDYRAINVHSMKCHCYQLHTPQYDLWIEKGRLNFAQGSPCPFCLSKSDEFIVHDLGQFKQHLDEFHLEETHKYALSIGCSCKRSFGGTSDLFSHWAKDQCDGSPVLLPCLPLDPQLFANPTVRTTKR